MTPKIAGLTLSVAVFLAVGAAQTAETEAPTRRILARHYVAGEKLSYHMTGTNGARTYGVDAIGEVKRDQAGHFFEEYEWRGLTANGVPVTPAHPEFRQRLSLDEAYGVAIPELRQADPALIGPVLDLLNFYADVRLAMRQPDLRRAGDHTYFKHGKPNSWADGHNVLIGEDVIDFDLTLAAIDNATRVAKLVVRHVPPAQPKLKLPVAWMRAPIVTGQTNNWIQVAKSGGDYVAAVGSEIIKVELEVSTADGKIISGRMDNPIEVSERICADGGLTRCGAPRRYEIRRRIALDLRN